AIQSQHDSTLVVDGDTLQLPSCSVSWGNGDKVVITKAIAVVGNGCTLDSKGRPTVCNTVITNNHTDGQPVFGLAPGATSTGNPVANLARVSSLEIDGAAGIPKGQYIIYLEGNKTSGSADDGRRVRLDHILYKTVRGFAIYAVGIFGVADHLNVQ